jgi:hypothetical protein
MEIKKMTMKYVAYSILIMPMLLLSLSANAYAGTIRIEGILEEPDKISGTYDFPKDGIFEISNNSKICPSNQCKLIPNSKVTSTPSGMFLAFSEEGNSMTLAGYYRLQDDITNGHFTPKKQKLVEGVDFFFICLFDDIQENKNGTTKYLCSDEYTTNGATRTFNHTSYPYVYSASFELPSRHFVLNAEDVE